MALSCSNSRSLNAEPNVTPLIDVLLVLLIIFMVIVPVTPRGLEAMLPQHQRNGQPMPTQAVVVRVVAGLAGPTYTINDGGMQGRAQLATELDHVYSVRAEKVLFVKGDPTLNFESVADVIDLGHTLGIEHIGILTPGMDAR